ncbi:zinc transporter ZupT [Desulfurivibrio alkaliphilus]|uniref:Zinc transporter ZupT n=1 Tax=Desulfurivibrio alkaliphilus (strain DSM 19089 / UNIQEM U267 / AHT2) TaxID=589865 RepID=D6Z175_DESAT|nr:zinc transporter ZupT [Desulfurivibrio alkaliphilus]ADH85330.1 zinc/iron permease [Desulfurivibrio alkaliphilus AHT 2]
MAGFELSAIIFAFSLTLLAGLSTAIGGVVSMFVRPHNTVGLSLGLGFSAGVMIYVSLVELLPEAMESFSLVHGDEWGYALATGAFFAGIAVAALVDLLIPGDVNPHEYRAASEFSATADMHADRARSLKRTGMFTALAVALHNFPEGFATFSVALLDPALGIPIAIAIAIHNIPEGVAVALPIYHGSGSRGKGFVGSLLSGLAQPLGAVVGFLLLAPFLGEGSLGLIFAMVAGIMVYISFDELFPAARLYGNSHTPIIGLLSGMLVMALSLVLFEFF